MSKIAFIAWLPVVLVAGSVAAAPPKLESLFPAGTARGCELVVKANGSFSNWPVQVWVDRPGLQIQAAEEKGDLRINVDADAPCGVYWLRLYSDEGASALRPFLVGTLAEVTEQEPNDGIGQSQQLPASVTVNGRLEKMGDVDGFAMKLQAGQRLVASLQANTTLGSPMDGVLQICSEPGFVLQQNDDARGLDPLLTFVAPQAGTYIVRTFAFPSTANGTIGFAGSSSYIYRLTLTTGGFLDHALPLAIPRGESVDLKLFGWNIPPEARLLLIEANTSRDSVEVFHPRLASTLLLALVGQPCLEVRESSSPEQPQTIELPSTISGRIESAGDEDVFEFSGVKGQKVVFRAESDSLGYLLDPLLVLSDSAGKELARVDDTDGRDAVLRLTLPTDGPYRLLFRDVHGHGGLRYAYRLTARQEQPDFTIKLAADSFVLTPGESLEISLAIGRLEGFSNEIQISACGLPEGVTAESVKSEATGDSSKSVKLVLRSDLGPAAVGTVQIIGTEIGGAKIQRTATYSLGATPRRGKDIWLTVSKK